jgi:hypothetical protein
LIWKFYGFVMCEWGLHKLFTSLDNSPWKLINFSVMNQFIDGLKIWIFKTSPSVCVWLYDCSSLIMSLSLSLCVVNCIYHKFHSLLSHSFGFYDHRHFISFPKEKLLSMEELWSNKLVQLSDKLCVTSSYFECHQTSVWVFFMTDQWCCILSGCELFENFHGHFEHTYT